MRFMMIVKGNADYEAGKPPDPRLMAAIAASAEKESSAGRMLGSGGLLPSAAGARVRLSRGKIAVTDGPFAEAKELVGGYAIFDLPSKEEAVEGALGFVQLHLDVLGPGHEMEVEVRQMWDGPPGEC